jgi:ubiquinone/menaquinone biosynthesis C-methylase UbiE
LSDARAERTCLERQRGAGRAEDQGHRHRTAAIVDGSLHAEAGVQNVEFRKGYLEDIPLEDASVDVVISNCVINLAADKPQVLREAARVLRPGGRFAVSDVIADPDMDEQTRADMAAWTGCIAGALTAEEFRSALTDAGFDEIEIRETHRVHEHAGAAIIRASRGGA